jgi:outer membrane protein OmpA-like peptidoglycan-associated protein
MKRLIIGTTIVALSLTGCATKTQTGALVGTGVGAAVGAGLGQAIGHSTSATLIGAAAGAVAGGLAGGAIGNYMDRQEEAMRQALAQSEAASIQREQQVLAQAESSSTKKSVEVLTVTFKSDFLFAVNSSTLNQKLSERRAKAVKDALAGMGVDPNRMTTIGYGESKPIASNASESGRLKNRRVEIRIVPQTQQ